MASRRGLAIDGVLLLDKPPGLSSNHALQRARRILNARKAGHTGTLDPFATGLMVLCFGEATKFSGGMFEADKSYRATLQFGAETDSGDCTGNVVAVGSPTGDLATGVPAADYPWLQEPERLRDVLSRFTGTISQVPPMYSALKRDGQPLYKYARQGIELEREPRTITIYGVELLGCDVERGQASIEVSCSKGTYIRTLAQDIGRALGSGAHLTALRRTSTAGFDLDQALTLEQLESMSTPVEALHVADSLLADLPRHTLDAELARRFSLGQTVPGVAVPTSEGRLRLYAPNEQFLGTARLDEGWLRPDRLMALHKESST